MSEQLYDIRLPDGSPVQWTAQQIADYEDNWQVNLMVIKVKSEQVLREKSDSGSLLVMQLMSSIY